jgi:hypothetical protein
MSPIYFYNGKILTENGKIAINQACCCGCDKCQAGVLPDTVTVTFDGYPDLGPTFDALTAYVESCYGFGADVTAAVADGAISAITVTNGGSGYATLARVEPTITADGSGGTGADITVTLAEEADFCGLPYWTITGLTVVDGGSGYTDGGEVVFTLGGGEIEEFSAYATVAADEDGAITGLFLLWGGSYYGEDPDAPALVADVTITLDQVAPSNGSGAAFTVNVDDDPDSPTFGEITSVTVDDGGDGYAEEGTQKYCLGQHLNGKPLVLAKDTRFGNEFATTGSQCNFTRFMCLPPGNSLGNSPLWGAGQVNFGYRTAANGKSQLTFPGPQGFTVEAVNDSENDDCSDLLLEFANGPYGATATVTTGGGSIEEGTALPPKGSCGSCCLGEEAVPEEITLSLENLADGPNGPIPDGDYVLQLADARTTPVDLYSGAQGDFRPYGTYWFLANPRILVHVEPCALLDIWDTNYWLHDAPDCGNNCNNTCRTYIFTGVPAFPDSNNKGNAPTAVACSCDEFPVCGPAAGPHTLYADFFLNPPPGAEKFRVTISW